MLAFIMPLNYDGEPFPIETIRAVGDCFMKENTQESACHCAITKDM